MRRGSAPLSPALNLSSLHGPAGRTRIDRLHRGAFALFGAQLALNFAWSFLFFRFHLLGTALVELFLLWLAVLAMILAFRKVRPAAAWLQIPYLLWAGFAGVLNASIWLLNR